MEQLNLKYPLILAPLAGGPSTVELVAAASEAGALGSMGAAYSTASEIKEFVEKVRRKTAKPFSINLFIPTRLSNIDSKKAVEATKHYRAELQIPEPPLAPPFEEDFDAQFAQVMDLRPAAFSFIFGTLSPSYIKDARSRGIFIMGTATSPDEAEALAVSGVDAIVLQGLEAGGHRAIFSASAKDPEITMLDLLKRCSSQINRPLIAAGGIMNSDDIKHALSLGARAVQMGTAFLACKEAGTSAPYRAALLRNKERETKTTRVFSGRLARGLKNRFMTEMELQGPEVLLPFPAQNKFTRDLRNASAKRGSSDFLSLWSGSGKGELWPGTCGELITKLFSE